MQAETAEKQLRNARKIYDNSRQKWGQAPRKLTWSDNLCSRDGHLWSARYPDLWTLENQAIKQLIFLQAS